MAMKSSSGVSNFCLRLTLWAATVLILLVLNACAKKDDSQPGRPAVQQVVESGKIADESSTETEESKKRAEALKQISADLIQFHEQLFKKSFQAALSERLKNVPVTTDLKDLKERLERAVSSSEIIYNSDASNLGDIILNSEMQCYSGTTLFVTHLLLKATAEQWREMDLVVIHTSGHILPGFVVRENSQFHLYGIEMTASDDGLVDFGMTENITIPMIVVDAEYWASMEASKNKMKKEMHFKAVVMANETHKQYKIPFNEKLIADATADESLVTVKGNMRSPFAFGVPPELGKVKRSAKPNNLDIYRGESKAGSNAPVVPKKEMNTGGRPFMKIVFDKKAAGIDELTPNDFIVQKGKLLNQIPNESLDFCRILAGDRSAAWNLLNSPMLIGPVPLTPKSGYNDKTPSTLIEVALQNANFLELSYTMSCVLVGPPGWVYSSSTLLTNLKDIFGDLAKIQFSSLEN